MGLFGLLYSTHSDSEHADGPRHAYPPLDQRPNRTDPQPRCGAASGRMALFAADVTCPACLTLMARQNADTQTDATDYEAIERGAQIDAAVEATGHLPGHHDADGADQAWFWTEEWQAGEREADAQIAAGGLPVYDDMAALLADIDSADDAPDETRWLEPSLGPCPHCPCPTDVHSVGLGCVLCDCVWGREAQR